MRSSNLCLYSPEVDVEDAHGDADGERDQDHGEEEIFSQQRHGQRRWRDDFSQQQEEHSERQQDRDAERDFLARVGRQIEDQHGQESNADARNNQVHRVKERLSPHH